MKYFSKNSLLFITFFSFVCFSAADQITFQKVIASSSEARCIQQSSDGGYIITGMTLDSIAIQYEIYLAKIDSTGNIIFSKTIGQSGHDNGNFVQQTSDGGYIITGVGNYINTGDDIYLIKTNSNGDSLWTKRFAAYFSDNAYWVKQTLDGGFILAGGTNSSGTGGDAYMIKTDANGDTLWTRTLGIPNAGDYVCSVEQTIDSGYILVGSTSNAAGINDIYLIKTDKNGELSWSKTFGGAGDDWGFSVQQTNDGGFVVAGRTSSIGAGNFDVCLIKLDSIGNLNWSKTYGSTGNEYGYSVLQTSDGGFVVAGFAEIFPLVNNDAYLIKLDPNGDTLWTRTFGEGNNDFVYMAVQTFDGGYIMVGVTQGIAGNHGIYLIKTDPSGNSGCYEGSIATTVFTVTMQTTNPPTISGFIPINVTTSPLITGSGGITNTVCLNNGFFTPDIHNQFLISPNPTSSSLTIHTSLNLQNSEVEIYNLLGETVCKTMFPVGKEEITIDVSDLSPGLYFVKVQTEKGTSAQKLIIQ